MTEKNPFHAPIKSVGAVVPVEQHRAVQEVQAAMIIAKKFPRDQHAAYSRIMTACERPALAEAASYDYPKGGTMITGPTIRLAEVLAINWGNMEFGIKELSQEGGESEVQAFAWDLETNVRQSKTFRVLHKMKAHGSFKSLTDPRDIYEHVANMGARRLRACILGIIPGDIVGAAVIKCEETLIRGDGKPIEDRVRDMLEKFKEIEISQELIEKRLQHKTTAIVRSQLIKLGKIYNSIKDGMSKRSDWFEIPVSQQETPASDLADKIKENEKHEPPPEDRDTDPSDKQEPPPDAKKQDEKADQSEILCPYCKAKIKEIIATYIKVGGTSFACPVCHKQGYIENGLPIAIDPIGEAGKDNAQKDGIDPALAKIFGELTLNSDAAIFWRMREKGLDLFFDAFEDKMKTWPKEIQDFVMAKCKNIAGKHPEFVERFEKAITVVTDFPALDGDIPKADDDEDWNGLYYDCPNMDGKPIPRVACKNCDRREGCPTPFIPRQAKQEEMKF